MEGVMMRSPRFLPSFNQKKKRRDQDRAAPLCFVQEKMQIFKIPLIRGIMNFIDMLYIGVKTLMFSAEEYEADDNSAAAAPAKPVLKIIDVQRSFCLFYVAIFIFCSAAVVDTREHQGNGKTGPVQRRRVIIKIAIFLVYLAGIWFAERYPPGISVSRRGTQGGEPL